MQRSLFCCLVIVLAACNSNPPAQTESMKSGTDSMAMMIHSPYPVSYSSQFAIDSPKYAETVLQLWKDYDNGNLSAHKDLLADTLEFHFSDGGVMKGGRDSMIAIVQRARDSFGKVVDRVDAVMAVKSTDKGEHWALIWGIETDTDKKGKVDSVNLQETWRLNKDGKADLVFQYRQLAAPPKK